MPNEAESRLALVGYKSGREGTQRINEVIEEVWSEILSETDTLAEIAQEFFLAPKELSAKLSHSPFSVKAFESGIGPVEVAFVTFVSSVAYDLAKEVVKTGTKISTKFLLLILWEKFVKPRVESKLPSGAIGDKSRLFDDVQ
jgi:hypothetical protein